MTTKTTAEIVRDGLWTNNPGLVQLLGLCPLLAVSGTVVNALGLGLATCLVLLGSNLAVSLIRNHLIDSLRLPTFVMIIAALVTCAELLMQAFAYELYEILGIFMPLIVTNCIILGRAEAFARRHGPLPAALDGLMMGLGFALVLVLLGALRELIGQGTLFQGMELLFGPMAQDWEIRLFENYPDFLFALLPPGAFIGLGLLIALKNLIDRHLEQARAAAPVEPGRKRVRVTGPVA